METIVNPSANFNHVNSRMAQLSSDDIASFLDDLMDVGDCMQELQDSYLSMVFTAARDKVFQDSPSLSYNNTLQQSMDCRQEIAGCKNLMNYIQKTDDATFFDEVLKMEEEALHGGMEDIRNIPARLIDETAAAAAQHCI